MPGAVGRTFKKMMKRIMVQSSTKQLLQYWNKVRGARKAPTRIEIVPAEISNILPVTFILEITDQQELRYRLAGSRMCEYFGQEFRGIDFFATWPQSEQPILRKYLAKLSKKGAVITLVCEARSKHDHSAEFEIVLLPLTHSGTRIDRVLGAIAANDDLPWLGAATLDFCEIKEVHVSLLRGSSLATGTVSDDEPLAFIPHKRLVDGKTCQLRVFDGGKANNDL